MGPLAALTPFLGTIGAVAGGVGTLVQGNYAAQVASNNAQIERQNAAYTEAAGQEQAGVASLKGAAQSAQIRNAMAANNVDVNSGSATEVGISQRGTNELDAETVLNNADLQAYGYTTQAVNDQAQSQQDEVGGILGAVGSIASKASSINLSSWGSLTGGNGASTTSSSDYIPGGATY